MKLELSKKDKLKLGRIIVALCLFIAVFSTDKAINLASVASINPGWILPFVLYFAIYVIIGYDIVYKAVVNIFHGQIFDENFLMCVASLGAFALAIFRGATGQTIEGFDEACAVLLFYQFGEFFQSVAVGKSRKDIAALMDIRPDVANVLRDGCLSTVSPDEVRVGEIITVFPGEKVPLDGVIVKGESSLDVKALTGEAVPVDVAEGDTALSGSVNVSSEINVRVEKEFYDSTVSKILDLVENASDKKSKTENFITKFAKYYTPTVVGVAALLAIIPSAITGDWQLWIYRALSFLVVSCPCALVISIPLSFFAGLGAASRYGILIKGSDFVERFNKANIFVFDKTGTITKGCFEVSDASPLGRRDEILTLAATAEQGSSHPIAKAICSAAGGKTLSGYTVKNEAGRGVVATNGSDVILCGNAKLLAGYGVKFDEDSCLGTAVYVAKNGEYVGRISVEDAIKDDSANVIAQLKDMGAKTVMLTGDSMASAAAVAEKTGVDMYKASLLPADKVAEVETLLSEKRKGYALCFVGDGINDAPSLSRADIGIAMGGIGSDAAIEASDIVLMNDDLSALPLAKRITKKTMRVVYENIVFSLAVKFGILILSALGITNMWIAVFGDVGVAIIAILNAIRVNTKYKPLSANKKHK